MARIANGAELIATHKDQETDTWVILVKWRDEYVTARINKLTDKSWYWGRYYPNTNDGWIRAFGDYSRRSESCNKSDR